MADYYEYLQQRNPISIYYRKYLMYPLYAKLLLLSNVHRGLEIGCGLGEFLEVAPKFEGIDLNPNIVQHVQNKGLTATVGNAYEIPFEEQTFDAIIMDNVLEHLDDAQKCFQEVKRCLLKEGRFLIIVPNQKGWQLDPTHVTYWDETNLPQAIEKAGFTVTKDGHAPLPKKLGNLWWPYNIYYLLAKNRLPQ